MKKLYFSPEASLIELENDDILTTSGRLTLSSDYFGGKDKKTIGVMFK